MSVRVLRVLCAEYAYALVDGRCLWHLYYRYSVPVGSSFLQLVGIEEGRQP